jgi:RNA polymerase sigma-70 factor (ECF subfamily)
MVASNRAPRAQAERENLAARDFDQFHALYFGFVWRCLRGLGVHEASLDEAAQDVFMVVHRRLQEFRGEASLRTWLYSIVRNVAANQRRSQQRHAGEVALEIEPPSQLPAPDQQLSQREAAAFVRAFLDKLDEFKREIFVLVLLEELNVTDVAETLQIPVNTAYTRLRAVRLEFQQALERERLRTRP